MRMVSPDLCESSFKKKMSNTYVGESTWLQGQSILLG